MINTDKLIAVIAAYKEYFPTHWGDEKFKWEAIKHFQDHWDINAPDFVLMFETATDKTFNLLASGYFYPRKMILNFAKADAEATRAMFIRLFDDSVDLAERVDQFQSDAEDMRSEHDDGTWKNHFQNTNAISTYLWLRFPDKYYIYKYSECLALAKELESDFVPKRTSSSSNMLGGYKLLDEISESLQKDAELAPMLKSHLTDSCYPDSGLKTMAIDVEYFVSRFYKKRNADTSDWFPADYSPKLTVDDWLSLLEDSEVFTTNSLEIMKRMKDYGGMATCTQLAVKYGETKNFYNIGSSTLARRIVKKTGCPVMLNDTKNAKWWPVLYQGKYADKEVEGIYVWKLREELSEALDQVDLSNIALYALDKATDTLRYWLLNANPRIWSFTDFDVGQVQSYTLFNDNGNKRRIFQNFLDAQAGDRIIGYEANPVKQVVALAKVTQEQDGERLYFEKTEGLSSPIDYLALKSFPELERMEYFVNPQGSLFKLTKGEYDFIMDIIREANPVAPLKETIEEYSRDNFLSEVYMSGDNLDNLIARLKTKKNLVLQGAPGVGKTFTAKRLAYAMMGIKDDSRIELIQFHQNYSYEDFIMGYKPRGDGFELENGVFYRFCQKAANHPDEDYFFIIDEINRGNMSKIFGELLMLIENDYRGTKATLAYSGTQFSVPKNLYLIGMMNTADRSLAMIDYALRRRFSFYEMEPGYSSEGFRSYQEKLDNETFDSLVELIKELNREISNDSSLGKGFRIGHSYFCGQKECTDEWMNAVVYYDIIPMLSEYWFDEPTKIQRWENRLSGVLNV